MGLEPVVLPMLFMWLLACFCFLCLLACFFLVMSCDMPWSSLLTAAPDVDVLPVLMFCAKATGAPATSAATMSAGKVIFMEALLGLNEAQLAHSVRVP